MQAGCSVQIVSDISLCLTAVAAAQRGRRSVQTRIKHRMIRSGIVALALLAVLLGAPDSAAQTFDEAMAASERGDYATAIRGFRVQAEQGNAEAQYEFGRMYDMGRGTPEDDAEAARWYRKAAEQGHVRGQYQLGASYDLGVGVPADKAEAARWYRKAAEQGDAQSQYELGKMYDLGQGVPEDDTEARKWLRKAGEQGHVSALFTLALFYDHGWGGVTEDDAEAVKWYRKVTEQGHSFFEVDTQYRLGVMYRRGEGVPTNKAEAARWFREAAEQGETRAQYSLGVMYAYGEGVTENDAEAVKWLRKAARLSSYDRLFRMYAYGDGLPKDHTEAMKWFRRAAEQSYIKAAGFKERDLMRAHGEIVPEDLEDYDEWYRKAADVQFNFDAAVRWFRTVAEHEQDFVGNSAQFNLGVIYDIGLGVPEDNAEAARWLRKTGDNLFLLVDYQDDAKTVKWLRRFAELGFAVAQYRLGLKYAYGEGVPKDYVRAYAWSNLAAAQGDKGAAWIRDELQSGMTSDQIARAQELSATLFNRIYQSR